MTVNFTAVSWCGAMESKKTGDHCAKCGESLTADEIAVTKKLVNRGTKKYFCVNCLAEAFDVEPDDIRKKIQYFKEMGCTLFNI